MVDARQVAYLQALGVDVYVPRRALAPHPDDVANLDWDELRAAVAACQRCDLHATRTQTVFEAVARPAGCSSVKRRVSRKTGRVSRSSAVPGSC